VSAARITAQAPVLFVSDLPRTLAYWRERVGFETAGIWGEPPNFAILSQGVARLMLRQAPMGHAIVPHWRVSPALWNAYFWVDDAAAFYDDCVRRGATIDYELCTQPYGVLEFGIRDLDDQDIGFGQVLDTAAN
jgi:hypothetical protein